MPKARGTYFNSIHSHDDLGLIQLSLDVEPAQPKLNLVDIPGADGSKDLTELPAGRVTYKDRKLTWTFGLYPGADWEAKFREVSNALNGLRCDRIVTDPQSRYHYTGRLTVKKYKHSKLQRQITVEATCAPFQLRESETVVTQSLTTTAKSIAITNNGGKTVTPSIKVTAATVLTFGNSSVTINAGTHTGLDIVLVPGSNTLTAKTSSGSGTIEIRFREGSL